MLLLKLGPFIATTAVEPVPVWLAMPLPMCAMDP